MEKQNKKTPEFTSGFRNGYRVGQLDVERGSSQPEKARIEFLKGWIRGYYKAIETFEEKRDETSSSD